MTMTFEAAGVLCAVMGALTFIMGWGMSRIALESPPTRSRYRFSCQPRLNIHWRPPGLNFVKRPSFDIYLNESRGTPTAQTGDGE
jgi:hypothetical protein